MKKIFFLINCCFLINSSLVVWSMPGKNNPFYEQKKQAVHDDILKSKHRPAQIKIPENIDEKTESMYYLRFWKSNEQIFVCLLRNYEEYEDCAVSCQLFGDNIGVYTPVEIVNELSSEKLDCRIKLSFPRGSDMPIKLVGIGQMVQNKQGQDQLLSYHTTNLQRFFDRKGKIDIKGRVFMVLPVKFDTHRRFGE